MTALSEKELVDFFGMTESKAKETKKNENLCASLFRAREEVSILLKI